MSIDLFAYGVLMHSELLEALTGRTFVSEPASLHGFRRYALEKEGWPRIPVVVAESDGFVSGVLVRGVDEASIALLDEFEDVDLGLYVRQWVTVVGGGRDSAAVAYLAGPGSRDFLSGAWHPEQFFERHYDDYRLRIIPGFLNDR